MKKLIPLMLIIILLLSSCFSTEVEKVEDIPDENLPAPQSIDELYELYGNVSQGMTKEELDSLYGEPTPSYDDFGDIKFYTYFNEIKSSGVSVIFDTNDTVATKILFFNSKTNLIPFSGRYIDEKIPLIKTDMSLEAAASEMGSSPLEISCQYTNEGPDSTKNIFCWYNEDGSNFMVHTETGIISNVILYRD